MKTIAIIGGGIVGLATAYKILSAHPDWKIHLLEKEADIARHQSGNNSGVLHCGLYYRPGSFKANLAVSGIRQMVDFCEKNSVPFEICGKLVVATSELEKQRLESLRQRGTANGLRGIRYIERDEMKHREPQVGGIAALEVPEEGIVDYPAVCRILAEHIVSHGGSIHCGTEVLGLTQLYSGWRIHTNRDEYYTDYVVNCAGLFSDRICQLSGLKPKVKIVPFRGEYYQLKKESQHLVNHLIYPVPDPAFPFLGVHFSRLIHGGIEAGPNAVPAFAREGYTTWTIDPGDLADTALFPGMWRFARRYPAMCARELRQSISKKRFCAELQKLVPAITPADLEKGGAGVRAQAMNPDGSLVEDFSFVRGNGILHVVNAPSPAATASLAIADEIVSRIPAEL